jgi:hypothetical protein
MTTEFFSSISCFNTVIAPFKQGRTYTRERNIDVNKVYEEPLMLVVPSSPSFVWKRVPYYLVEALNGNGDERRRRRSRSQYITPLLSPDD